MTTVRRFGRNLPAAGGGYCWLLPTSILSTAIRELNRQGQPAVVYLHPYELSVTELARLKLRGWRLSWKTLITQSLFRERMLGQFRVLFKAFKFAPMAKVLGLE